MTQIVVIVIIQPSYDLSKTSFEFLIHMITKLRNKKLQFIFFFHNINIYDRYLIHSNHLVFFRPSFFLFQHKNGNSSNFIKLRINPCVHLNFNYFTKLLAPDKRHLLTKGKKLEILRKIIASLITSRSPTFIGIKTCWLCWQYTAHSPRNSLAQPSYPHADAVRIERISRLGSTASYGYGNATDVVVYKPRHVTAYQLWRDEATPNPFAGIVSIDNWLWMGRHSWLHISAHRGRIFEEFVIGCASFTEHKVVWIQTKNLSFEVKFWSIDIFACMNILVFFFYYYHWFRAKMA